MLIIYWIHNTWRCKARPFSWMCRLISFSTYFSFSEFCHAIRKMLRLYKLYDYTYHHKICVLSLLNHKFHTLQLGIKMCTQNFPKNQHFLPPDTHTNVYASGGKKCWFFRRLCLRTCAHQEVRNFTFRKILYTKWMIP